MNEAEFRSLLETSWRRPLSQAEEARLRAWLAAHPDAQTVWEEEAGLTQLLEQLPNVPVASNFSARILHAVEQDAAAESRSRRPRLYRRLWSGRWRPRIAGAVVLATLGLLAFQVYHKHQHDNMVQSFQTFETLARIPYPESLKDFEAIQQLSTAPPLVYSDVELLAALQ